MRSERPNPTIEAITNPPKATDAVGKILLVSSDQLLIIANAIALGRGSIDFG
jgi:hypothetical protein